MRITLSTFAVVIGLLLLPAPAFVQEKGGDALLASAAASPSGLPPTAIVDGVGNRPSPRPNSTETVVEYVFATTRSAAL